MASRNVSRTGRDTKGTQNLSPEEQAILSSSGSALLSGIFTAIWRIKLRLQFTGWLQYTPTMAATLVSFGAAAIAHYFGLAGVAWGFAVIGALTMAESVFEVVTVKYRVRFPERLPRRNDDLDMFDVMRKRRSCRSFQTRKLTPRDHEELMEHVRMRSDSSTIGASPVRFEYVSAPITVWPSVNATEFLVAIAPRQYDRLAVIDIGRNLQKIVIDATRMGLGTCWIGPGADQSSVAQRLGDRFNIDKDHIICVCAIGYKSRYIPVFLRIFNRQFHWRLPLSSLFFADAKLKKPVNVAEPPLNRFGRAYEACQWSPSSYNGQTTRCVAVMNPNDPESRALARFDFYANTNSRYYAAVAMGIWCANWEMGCEALGIPGHFSVLSPLERGLSGAGNPHQVPRYDVSWVLDQK